MASGTIERPSAVYGSMNVRAMGNVGNTNRRLLIETLSTTAEQLFFIVAAPTNNSTYYVSICSKGGTDDMFEYVVVGTTKNHGRNGSTLFIDLQDWSHVLIFSDAPFNISKTTPS